jgi:hypothetical protein
VSEVSLPWLNSFSIFFDNTLVPGYLSALFMPRLQHLEFLSSDYDFSSEMATVTGRLKTLSIGPVVANNVPMVSTIIRANPDVTVLHLVEVPFWINGLPCPVITIPELLQALTEHPHASTDPSAVSFRH